MCCRRLADSSSGRLKAFDMVMAETPRCLAKDFRFTPSRRGGLDLAGVARRTRQIRRVDYNVKDTKSSLLPLTLKSRRSVSQDGSQYTTTVSAPTGYKVQLGYTPNRLRSALAERQ